MQKYVLYEIENVLDTYFTMYNIIYCMVTKFTNKSWKNEKSEDEDFIVFNTLVLVIYFCVY